MYCSFSLFLLLIISPPSVPSVSTIFPHTKKLVLNTMIPSETETLFNVMESMSSDRNWRISYPNPCKPGSSWPGIVCKPEKDNYLHVSRLDFGTHPNPTCKNTATFPNQIFALPYIQSVFFISCFTLFKTTLNVSPNRLLNSSLEQISLRSNPALVGSIPPQFSSLKSLKILTLSQNSFTGNIPVGIFSLSSLVHLDLSYNMLTGTIPYLLGNLKNLIGLDLSYNSLSGSIPDTIGQLGLLQKLDLSSNLFIGHIPNSIEKLTTLVFMALSNNQLQGNVPKGLEKLQSLQYIIMDNNPMFIPLPMEFGKLVKLQELRLANSGYSGTIPPTFSQLTNLSTLSLQNNRLIGEIPTGFSGFSHMYHLNLSKNFLAGVVPFNLSFLKRLGRNMDLSGNIDLCLNPSEAYGVKIGVNVCGSENGSVIQPLKKSQAAPYGFSKSFSIFTALGYLGLQLMLSLA